MPNTKRLKVAPAELEIAGFLSKYTPEVRADFEAARAKLQTRFPRGFELVYDNYNAFAVGYAPSVRASDAIVSIAAYPKWVTLFFLQGKVLPDPTHRLQGDGVRVRSIRLASPATLDEADVQNLITLAIRPVEAAFALAPSRQVAVKSVSAKQRPRRPSAPSKHGSQ